MQGSAVMVRPGGLQTNWELWKQKPAYFGAGDLNREDLIVKLRGVVSQLSQQLALKWIMKLILVSDVYWGQETMEERGRVICW